MLIGVFHSVESHGVAAHAVAVEEDRNVRVFSNCAVNHHIGVIENLVEVVVVGALAFGAAVTAVIEAIGSNARLVHLLSEVIVAAEVLAQAVHHNENCLVLWRHLLEITQLGAVERFDEFICHSGLLGSPTFAGARPREAFSGVTPAADYTLT